MASSFVTYLQRFAIPVLWVGAVAAGFGGVLLYESDPGPSAFAKKSEWPTASTFKKSDQKPTLLLFAHPGCPCTRASMVELRDLLAKQPSESYSVIVALVKPHGLDLDVGQSEIARIARQIEGARLVVDPDGVEAKRFGAKTSGQTLVFSPEGRRLFAGGLTSYRGHYGPSDGLDAVSSILTTGQAALRTTPVFGCSLLGDVSGKEGR